LILNQLEYNCFFPNETPNLQQIRPIFSSPWMIPTFSWMRWHQVAYEIGKGRKFPVV
jgi:hypothetical protein